jgi:hypothetical protein
VCWGLEAMECSDAEENAVIIIELDAICNIFNASFCLVNYLYFEKEQFYF